MTYCKERYMEYNPISLSIVNTKAFFHLLYICGLCVYYIAQSAVVHFIHIAMILYVSILNM